MPVNDITDLAERTPGSPLALSVGVVLHVLTGVHKGTTVRVGTRMSIGKGQDNDLVLTDGTVSRRHCELERTPAGIRVRDLSSRNGTFVDGTRVQDGIVAPGASLRVGDVDIAVQPAPQRLEVMPSEKASFGEAVGRSLAMRSIFGVLEYIAPSDATVLLEGETGTGKDVLARSIAKMSRRAKAAFVVVDCGAVAHSVLDSELFGHEKGAFTGALSLRRGAFEQADKGTLFLDEVGELPIDVQPKLLRALETRQFRRVGGNKTITVDIRIIAATKRDLQREVAEGRFREDLYYRLATVPVTVPPLRTRRDDVPLLVDRMLASMAPPGSAPLAVSATMMAALVAHDWPGNARELRNTLERANLLARALHASEIEDSALSRSLGPAPSVHIDPARGYAENRREFERHYVEWLIARSGGDVDAAAAAAGLRRDELVALLREHGLAALEPPA